MTSLAPQSSSSLPKESHIATCHCQSIKFRVLLPPGPLEGEECDCSHCVKRGIIWGQCAPEEFVLEKGEGLQKYEMGQKVYSQLFCKHCSTFIATSKSGSTTLPPPGEHEVFFNLRTLRDVDPHDISLKPYNGKSRPPEYHPPAPITHPFEPSPTTQILQGACHCQAVQFVVQLPTLGVEVDGKKEMVCDCNCSFCGGNGPLWIYPSTTSLHLAPSASSHLKSYSSNPAHPKPISFYSCKACGCEVYYHRDAMEGEGGVMYPERVGANIRLVDGLDLGKVGAQRFGTLPRECEPLYVVR